MQTPTNSPQSNHTTAPVNFTPPTPAPPVVATLRLYLDGAAEIFEMARRQAQAAQPLPGGAPDAEARRLFAR